MKQLICSAALISALFCGWQTALAEDPIRPDTEVVIKEGKDRTIQEYRHNGFVYAIKVIPKEGKPYFLVAADSEGNFIRTDKHHQMLIPSWKILEW
ncbi:DUF2782 domain-containing protein [Spartinivicinus ruber]|uniref:DUF2782 domain-containing protein n=1 Tax=Spartinivicinus ruber TaxID=2683272 RepID=UPI0013D3D1C0|nr:DUF2782 domain-containing protein [Spartinivicinus ruber]